MLRNGDSLYVCLNEMINEMVNEMMESDLKLMTKDQYLKDGGYTIMNYFE